MFVGSIASQFAMAFGLMATMIAVFGFVAHVRPALRRADEARLRQATVFGGVCGLFAAIEIIVLSALVG